MLGHIITVLVCQVCNIPTKKTLGQCFREPLRIFQLFQKKLESLPKQYSEVPELPSNHESDISAPVCTVNLPSYIEALSSLTEYNFSMNG